MTHTGERCADEEFLSDVSSIKASEDTDVARCPPRLEPAPFASSFLAETR